MLKKTSKLVRQLCSAQQSLLNGSFLAPCVPPARLCARIAGLVYTFHYDPGEGGAIFEGWGIFQPTDSRRARWVGEADPGAVESYLKGFRRYRLRLIKPLRGLSWLAYPLHADLKDGVVIVRLVQGGSPWAAIHARFDRRNLWWEGLALEADPRVGEAMVQALAAEIQPADLQIPGLTPADRSAYSVEFLHRHPASGAVAPTPPGRERRRVVSDEERLQSALRRGGGQLRGYTDQGQTWSVQWVDSRGALQSSQIRKDDLGVISAGICLSGEDAKFDLTSLVGVVEGFS